MRRGRLVAAVLLLLIALLVIGLVVLRMNSTSAYPTTREGWAERWETAAAPFGRTPGENWDLWLEVLSEIDAAIAEPGGPNHDRVGTALDRLLGKQITAAIPDTIGTERAIDDFLDLIVIARNMLRHTIWPQLTDALARNDLDEAHAWWDRAIAITHITETSGLLIGQLVQDACLMLLIDSLNDYLMTPDPVDTAWAADRADSIDVTDDLTWFIETEREFGLGMIVEQRAARGLPLLLAGDEARLYERLMDLWRDAHRGDSPAATAELNALEARLDADSIFTRRRPNITTILPSTNAITQSRRSVLMRLDGMKLMLALRRYQERTGLYPQSLDDLVPVELAALPRDTLAPDGRYRYRLLNAASADPRVAFILYSVGADGVDDGGNWSYTMAGNPLTHANATADHLFNRPRNDAPAETQSDAEDAEDAEQP